MIYPDYEKFKELSVASKMVAVSLDVKGDTDTPISLFKKLCNTPNCYLLESIEGGEKWGRYSYLGRNPFMIVKSYGRDVIIQKADKEIHKTGDVIDIVKQLTDEYKMVPMEDMPDFIGGAVGYIGYDTIRHYEHLPNVNEDEVKMPEVHLLFTKEVVVYDHVRQKIRLVVNVLVDHDLESLYKNAIAKLQLIKQEILESQDYSTGEKIEKFNSKAYTSNQTKEEYMEKVLQAKEYIKNGDVFQVVISQRLQMQTEINPFNAYRVLRSLNPSPYMFYMDFEQYHIVGSSPELLVKLKAGVVESCPIAGTRPRGKNKEQDEKYAKELLEDEKERAEHLMLVDLARNDIGKISKFGSVKINQFMEIQKYSHLMHIVSNVIGKIREDYNMYDALTACLPAGTVSGSPKVRAMEIIDYLENSKRGVYAGAIGYLGFNGNLDTCIAIRTMVFKDNMAYMQAGAGIVADSDPESEYEETLRKAKVLIDTIKIAEGRG